MATPEETRDRIKEMRDRIFNDSDKGSTGNNIQENPQEMDLAERNPKILETSEATTGNAKPAKPQETSSSEKLQQDDDSISFSKFRHKEKISEITPDFTGKLGILETAILDKLENAFAESNSKITEIEQRVNNSILSSNQANESLKRRTPKTQSLLQLDITSIAKDFLLQIKRLTQNFKTTLRSYQSSKILLKNARMLWRIAFTKSCSKMMTKYYYQVLIEKAF